MAAILVSAKVSVFYSMIAKILEITARANNYLPRRSNRFNLAQTLIKR